MLSNYVIEGKKAELDEFEAMLRRLEAMKEEDFPIKDVSWGSTWLGFIINELGQDWNGYNCKGAWYDLERRGDDALDGPVSNITSIVKSRAARFMRPMMSRENIFRAVIICVA